MERTIRLRKVRVLAKFVPENIAHLLGLAADAAINDLKMIQAIAKTMTRPFEFPQHNGPVLCPMFLYHDIIFRGV